MLEDDLISGLRSAADLTEGQNEVQNERTILTHFFTLRTFLHTIESSRMASNNIIVSGAQLTANTTAGTSNTVPTMVSTKYVPPALRRSPSANSPPTKLQALLLSDKQQRKPTSSNGVAPPSQSRSSGAFTPPQKGKIPATKAIETQQPAPKWRSQSVLSKSGSERSLSEGSSYTSSSRERTPSPKPKDVTSTDNEEPVEVWQMKRKGGNRAPKCEPEGTKNWRGLEPITQSPEAEATPVPQMPQPQHFPGGPRCMSYVTELINTIDTHLNVLIQCASPNAPWMSVRNIPFNTLPCQCGGCLNIHTISNLLSPSLPHGLTKNEFFGLLKSTLTICKITICEMVTLFVWESGRGYPQEIGVHDIKSQLQAVAYAQIDSEMQNHLEIHPQQNWGYSQRSFAKLQGLRNVTLRDTTDELKGTIKSNTEFGHIGHWDDLEQFASEHRHTFRAEDENLCRRLIENQWLGSTTLVPNYVEILVKEGVLDRVMGMRYDVLFAGSLSRKEDRWLQYR